MISKLLQKLNVVRFKPLASRVTELVGVGFLAAAACWLGLWAGLLVIGVALIALGYVTEES